MIKRTIEISSDATHITTKLDQLLLKRDGQTVGSVPCEDIGLVVADHPGTTYSHAALNSLLDSDAALVICGRDHLPQGVLLPLSDHSEVVWRIQEQLCASAPLKKRLWKQLVQAKICAQAENLDPDSPVCRKLLQFSHEVRSGDPTNREAQAAKIYWQAWLQNDDENDTPNDVAFRRQRYGVCPNGLLNYGYAILRAAMARALVAGGLIPAIGLHHSNRSNAFCLADDLMEPLRPIVDACVRDLYWAGETELTRVAKQALLELLTISMKTGDQQGPLMVSLHRMVASLVNCFQGNRKELEIPRLCKLADTDACGY